MDGYAEFLEAKRHLDRGRGIEATFLPDSMFDFQRDMTQWALGLGRAAEFADCGLGKTLMQLVWADNVSRFADGRVLILTPLAVGHQTVREGAKFGIECVRSADGTLPKGARIVVTNYERLHYFHASDFVGAVCDESGILKNFDGKRKAEITDFMRKMPYRLLGTATAAPNDYIELGTSSEALGYLGYQDMLSRFFTNKGEWMSRQGTTGGRFFNAQMRANAYRFRGHAEPLFWRWVCSWARAIRKPSDMGYDDGPFVLPPLEVRQHLVEARTTRAGMLFDLPAVTFQEQREERRRTINERCERVAEIVNASAEPFVVWCDMNDEGDLLARLIPDSRQVAGKDDDDFKERTFIDFADGQVRVLVTKPRIGGFGMNWQHCARQTFFPSHSFEQWYQAIRRSWRFGQKRPVEIDVVTSEGERYVLANLQRKAEAADKMFEALVRLMHQGMDIRKPEGFNQREERPAWL